MLVLWEFVEDPGFEEHLRRIFEIVMDDVAEPHRGDMRTRNPLDKAEGTKRVGLQES